MNLKTTSKRQVLDITADVQKEIDRQSLKDGICVLNLLHTTAALAVAELDYNNGPDLLAAFQALTPKIKFEHTDDPEHAGAHLFSALTGSTLSLIIESGKLTLGHWQRVILIELDGPRDRQIAVACCER